DDKLIYYLTAPYSYAAAPDVPFAWSVDGSQVKSVFYSFNKGSSWIEDADKDGFDGELSLSPGESAVVLIKVLTFDGKTGVYYIPVNRVADNSAALSALTVSGTGDGTPVWTPAFSPNDASTLNYTVAFPVAASISSQTITITSTAASSAASVEFVGETGYQFTLAPGGQKMAVIRVTAQNGSYLDYRISVIWTGATYTVNFMNGETPVSSANVNYDATTTLPALPKKEGAVAKGWYTALSGGQKLSGSTPAITADTNFYVQWLAYNASGIPPNASGGEVKYVSTSSGFDEVHIFRESGAFTMDYGLSKTGQALIVAGGGGGGGGGYMDKGGGGGGGGVQYASSVTISGSLTIIVGAGGNKGAARGLGGNGGNSAIGGIIAIGGGGGGAGTENSIIAGNTGGSGGGAGAGNGSTHQSAFANYDTTTHTNYTNINSSNVAQGGGSSSGVGAGGGGGAGGAGISAVSDTSGAGGSGYTSNITGANVTYAPGGAGGSSDVYGADAKTYYGEGGQGGGGRLNDDNFGHAGGSGRQGVVILRFPYTYMSN
ncbi:MAG: InlB B-repeat-containing protein, partial [Spirochaetaceae bacterium]|nr:InlB B-repeat-containing protein [Spirochaetaceae bacterium]